MIIIKPVEVDDSNLTSNNVAESGVQAWEFDKAYGVGARVVRQYGAEFGERVTPRSTNYRCLAYGNGVWIAL